MKSKKRFSGLFSTLGLLLFLMSFSVALSACEKGPTLENGEDIEIQESPDIDYRAEGPFSDGPSAPPGSNSY